MKQEHRVYYYSLLAILGVALVLGGTVLAAGEVLTRSAITIAGGQATVNGIEARSAVGQPLAGIVNSASGEEMCVGLMCPGSGSTQGVPLITPSPTATGSVTPGPSPTASTTPGATTTPGSTTTPTTTPTPGSTPPPTNSGSNIYLPVVAR